MKVDKNKIYLTQEEMNDSKKASKTKKAKKVTRIIEKIKKRLKIYSGNSKFEGKSQKLKLKLLKHEKLLKHFKNRSMTHESTK
jgi:hypothetical protein